MDQKKVRLVVHDYNGSKNTYSLARKLVDRGYQVLYLFALSNSRKEIPLAAKNLEVKYISIKNASRKSFYATHVNSSYGYEVINVIKEFSPDLIISSSTPLRSQKKISKWAHNNSVFSILWSSDIFSFDARRLLPRQMRYIGNLTALFLNRKEKSIIKLSDHIIASGQKSRKLVAAWEKDKSKVSILPPWISIDEIPLKPKDNLWSREHNLDDKFTFLYTGEISSKLDSQYILELAQEFKDNNEVRVVVVASGIGAAWLREKKKAFDLDGLIVLGIQLPHRLPEVLGSADVLVDVMPKSEIRFSISTKLMTYLCGGRPILVWGHSSNQSTRMIRKEDIGIAITTTKDDYKNAAHKLYESESLRKEYGQNARSLAEKIFDEPKIVDEFEKIIDKLLRRVK